MSFTKLHFDIDAIRAQVRGMKLDPGTLEDVLAWRTDDAESRACLVTAGKALTDNEGALFDMLLDEAVPPALATKIVTRLVRSGFGAAAA